MVKLKRQTDIREEIKKQYLYTINAKKYEEINKEFAHILKDSRYRTHLKIAVQEHAKFLNQLPQETKDRIAPPKNPKKAFLVLVGGEWRPNLKYVTEVVNQSIKTGETITFEFFNANVVLDKLREKLKDRYKNRIK